MPIRINNLELDADYIYGLKHEMKMIQDDLRILQKAPREAKLILGDREFPDQTLKSTLEKVLMDQLNTILFELDKIEIRYKKPE